LNQSRDQWVNILIFIFIFVFVFIFIFEDNSLS